MAAHTIVWAAGVQASRLGRTLSEQTGAPLDKAGRIVIPLARQPDIPRFSEGLAAVKLATGYGFIDREGRVRIEPQFSNAGDFSEASYMGSLYCTRRIPATSACRWAARPSLPTPDCRPR